MFEHIFDEFTFFKGKTVNQDIVKLAGDNWKLTWLLVEEEAMDGFFVLG